MEIYYAFLRDKIVSVSEGFKRGVFICQIDSNFGFLIPLSTDH